MTNLIESGAGLALRRLLASEVNSGGLAIEALAARGIDHPALLALAKEHDVARDSGGDRANPSPSCGPVLPAQRRLWSICSQEGGSAAYMLARAFSFEGKLEVNTLTEAITRVARRHEALRAVFCVRDGELVQEITDGGQIKLVTVDLAHDLKPRESALHLAEQLASAAPDLGTGPLAGATLYLLGGDQFVLLVWAHHIVCDGASWRILLAEIEACYRGAEVGGEEPAAAFSIPYAALAKFMAAETSEPALAYWDQRIAGRDLTLDLARDFHRTAGGSFHGNVERFEFEPEEAAALRQLSMATRTTPFLAVLALIKTLLARYTERTCICTLVPVAGRDWVFLENQVGFFAEALVSITDIDREGSFAELVGALTRDFAQDYKHRRISLEEVLARAVAANAMPAGGNFEVMVSMLEGRQTLLLGGIEGRPIALARRAAKMDISFEFQRDGNAIALEIEYRTALFTPARIRRIRDHFRQLLLSLSQDPQIRVKNSRLIPAHELREIVRFSTGDHVPWQTEDDFAVLFARAATTKPQAVAVRWQEERMSYAELDRRSDEVALAIARRGIRPGDLVGVCMSRDPRLIVTLVGVVKAGAAYLPIDPLYPRERIDYIVRDSRVSLVITSGDQNMIPAGIDALEFGSLIVSGAGPKLPARTGGESAMYVIYTSGSTGNPKGIVVSRRNVAGLIAWARHYYGSEELDNVLAATSVCFDISVFEIFVPLALGHSLSLVSNALALIDASRTLAPSLVNTVPSAIREIMLAGGLPHSVQTVNLAGELLPQHTVDEIKAKHPSVRVVDLYGPTEDTVYSTCGERTAGGEPSIGRPLANKQVWITDPDLQAVPLGVPGELLIGGTGLAGGYLHRDQLTAERFVIAELPNGTRERVYRTGDYGRFLSSGQIEFLGRRDGQHKIRGYRIELGEIEAAFRSLVEVGDVAVAVDKTEPERPELVAFLVLKPMAGVSLEAVRKRLLQLLPPFMVPAMLVEQAMLPQTPSGKVDRAALLGAYRRSKSGPLAQVFDRRLGSVVCQVLGMGGIPDGSSLTSLGGNSLSAVRISHEFHRRTGIRIPFIEILTASSLTTLAEKYDAATESAAEKWPRIGRDVHESFPLLPQQRTMWMECQFNPGSTAFHMCGGFRIVGTLEAGRLERSLRSALDRHEAFRLGFIFADGDVRQVLLSPGKSGIEHHDLRFEPDAPGCARHLFQEFAARRFDLRQGPLSRFAIVRLNETEWNLWCNLHHIICDGWSIQLLAQDISRLYEDAGSPPISQPQDRDFLDYVCALANDAGRRERAGDFWRQRLRNSFHHPIFAAFKGTGPKDAPAHVETINLPPAHAAALRRYAAENRLTLLSLTTALVHSFLHFTLGVPKISGGCIFANRDNATFQERAGLFMVTLPVVTDHPLTTELKPFADGIQEAIVDATRYPELALPEVMAQLASEGIAVNRQAFDVLVSQHEPWAALKLHGLVVTPLLSMRQTAKVALAVKLVESEDQRMSLLLEGAPAVFEVSDFAQMAAELAGYVRTMVQAGFHFRKTDPSLGTDPMPMPPEESRVSAQNYE